MTANQTDFSLDNGAAVTSDMDLDHYLATAASLQEPMPEKSAPEVDPRMEVNAFRHLLATKCRGTLIQFISHACVNAASTIGEMKVPCVDHKLLLNYLAKYEMRLRTMGRFFLDEHLIRHQGYIRRGRPTTIDDYVCSFMVQMSSGNARCLPSNRNEAGLWVLDHPHLLEPFRTSPEINDEANPEYRLVINAYINLKPLPPKPDEPDNKRKAEAARVDTPEAAMGPPPNDWKTVVAKKQKRGPPPPASPRTSRPGYAPYPHQRQAHYTDEVQVLRDELAQVRSQVKAVSLKPGNFPPMPLATGVPVWHKGGEVDFPPEGNQN